MRLARPLRLGPLEVRNRLVFPAHLTNAAVDGLPTAQHAAYYGARAAGGVGLVITEEQSVDPDDRPYEKLVRGTDPAVVPGYRAIADAVHTHGAAVLAQIGHHGGQASGRYSRAPVDAPSDIVDPMFREVPRTLSTDRIAALVAGFARVAGHVVAGGLDGVEVQASQASLIRQFLSPRDNHRTDAYGRDPARLLVEVLTAVRDVLGPGRVLGVRLQGDEGLPGGLTARDAAAAAVRVEGLVDYVNTSVGVATATLPLIEPPMGVPAGYASAVPSAVRAAVGVPVVGVGRFTTPAQAEHALAAGHCDLVGVVRGQIADPEFAGKALAGRPVRRCVGCNQECIGRVGLNRWLGCLVNPRAGREAVPVPAPRPRRRVLVVGGGPAGLAAASRAAERGHDVALVEAADVLGGRIRTAARGPGRDELGHLVDDLATACRAAGVRVRTGARLERLEDVPDVVVLAVGAAPTVPAWGAGLVRVVDVTDVLDGRVTPTGRVVVVDDLGDHAATSVAELLARRGATVTTLTSAMSAAGGLDVTLDRERWRRRAHALGITELTDRVVLAACAGPGPSVVLTVLDHPVAATADLAADWVVTVAPPTPRTGLAEHLAACTPICPCTASATPSPRAAPTPRWGRATGSPSSSDRLTGNL